MSKSSNTKSNQKNAPSQWAELIGDIVDKLVVPMYLLQYSLITPN